MAIKEHRILDKNEFLKFLNREEIFHGTELVNKFGKKRLSMNLGVPQLLIQTICQFTSKLEGDLVIEDAFNMYHTIKDTFDSEKDDYYELKKFRKQHNLSFFGMSQYELLEYYVDVASA